LLTLPTERAATPQANDRPGHPSSSMGDWFTLDWVIKWSWLVFGVQLAGVMVWTQLLFSHFSLTFDSTTFLQSTWLIAHGHLVPFSNNLGYPTWQDHFDLINWPLALTVLAWPDGLLLLWAQDIATIVAGVIAFRWMTRVIRESGTLTKTRWPPVLGAVGLFLLVANPWTYWAISWDIHVDAFATCFLLAATYDFCFGRMGRAWIWVALTLVCGDVAATWIIGLGISAAIAALVHKERRGQLALHATLLISAGAGWALAVAAIGADRGSGLSRGYGYLIQRTTSSTPKHLGIPTILRAVATHPNRALSQLWNHNTDALANLGPTAWIGAFTPWTFGVPAVILLEDGLHQSQLFAAPSFQSFPIFPITAVGIVAILCSLASGSARLRRVGKIGIAIIVMNAVIWAAVWLPPLTGHWLRVSSGQAAALNQALSEIPASAEVVASQGVMGRFSDRLDVRPLGSGVDIPVSGTDVWFVVTPNAGVEIMPVDAAMGAMSTLAGPMHAVLKVNAAGVAAFEWRRPRDVHFITFASQPDTIGGWTSTSAAGLSVTAGPVEDWHAAANGNQGYVVAQDYWTRPVGTYEVGVSLSAGSAVDVEVSNAADVQLLAARQVPSTSGILEVTIPLDLRHHYPRLVSFSGWGIFRIQPVAPASEIQNVLEVRVWSPTAGQVSVYSISLIPTAANR